MNKKHNIKHFFSGILLLLLLACPPAFAKKQQMGYGVEKPVKQILLQIHAPDGTYRYEYTLTDHLSSVRAVFTEDGSDADNQPDILASRAYMPGGMLMPGTLDETGVHYRFGYQGQFAEEDDETGYNQFMARLYDPRIGRWLIPDAAKQYWNPYLAMGNDPINGVDPDGTRKVYYNADGTYSHTTNNNFFHNLFAGNKIYIENANGYGYTNVSHAAFVNWQSDIFPQGWGLRAIDWQFTPKGHEINPVDGSILGGGALINVYPESFLFAPAKLRFGRGTGFLRVTKGSGNAVTSYYPKNSGALGKWSTEYLMPGTKIDRFGSGFGRYFSPHGTPMSMRALPPGNTGAYNTFKVVKPFPVQSSTIAPAFNQMGLGTQYLSPVNMNTLLKRGIIVPQK